MGISINPGGANDASPTGTVTLSSGSYATAVTYPGNPVLITVPAQTLAIGTDTLTGTYTPDSASAQVYSSASGTAMVTVTAGAKIAPSIGVVPAPASLTTAQPLQVAVSAGVGFGYQNPTGTVTLSSGNYASAATSLTGGITTINVSPGALAVGTDTITANYTPDSGSSAIYTSATGTAPVTVTQAPPPSFAVGNASLTLYPGATTGNSTNISVAPAGGFTGSVTLTAAITSSPAGAQDLPTLSFGATSPVSIIGASAGNAVLMIATTAATTAASQLPARGGPNQRSAPWKTAGGAAFAAFALFWPARRRRRWQTILGMLALLAVVVGSMLACSSVQSGGGTGGNGNPGTTAGTYTVTVTGVSGSETQTGTVTLTID